MACPSFESVFERKHFYEQSKNADTLNVLLWVRENFESTGSRIFENDSSESTNTANRMANEDVFVDMSSLSRKVMKEIWDNQEDEFWNTY